MCTHLSDEPQEQTDSKWVRIALLIADWLSMTTLSGLATYYFYWQHFTSGLICCAAFGIIFLATYRGNK